VDAPQYGLIVIRPQLLLTEQSPPDDDVDDVELVRVDAVDDVELDAVDEGVVEPSVNDA
jgi:hypothetical protein